MPAPDFAAEGLLDDCQDDRQRQARLELLEELSDAGVALDELRRAVRERRLALVPVELELGGGEERYSARQLADETGMDAEFMVRQRQALGLPRPDLDDPVLTEADRQAAHRAHMFRESGFDQEAGLGLLRVMGHAGAQVAEALRELVGDALVRPGDTERDLGRRYASFSRALGPQLGETLAYVTNLHLRESIRSAEITRAELETGRLALDAREVAVSFADLVGFTRLGADLPAGELGAVAGRLAAMASDLAEPPVRLVKTIGDAAMLVSPEAPALLDATLALVEAADGEGDDFPQLRAGVALGPALNRAGDWYGHTVNLASRVTSIARPGSVLATEEVHHALQNAYRWSFAGERRLKGIGEVKVFRARAQGPQDATD